MKTNSSLIKSLILGIGVAIALASCQEDPVDPIQQPETAAELSSILNLKANLATIKSNARGGVNSVNSAARSTAIQASMAQSSMTGARAECDSTDHGDDPWWEWETCAEVTETDNGDGSHTVVYDYGDGCYEGWDDYQVFIYGKYTDTYSWTENSSSDNSYSGTSSGNTVYENFGEKYEEEEWGWEYEIDGNSEYSSEFTDSWTEDDYSFSSNNSYKDDLTIKEKDDEETITISMTSDVEESSEYSSDGDNQMIITKGDYTYSDDQGNSYESRVITPLVMNFNCGMGFEIQNDGTEPADDDYVFTFVSGVEEFKVDGETYTIDYGDGTCDNIVTITDGDGNVEIVDLGEEWDEDDDEGDDND